jgi:hypothetical protein
MLLEFLRVTPDSGRSSFNLNKRDDGQIAIGDRHHHCGYGQDDRH